MKGAWVIVLIVLLGFGYLAWQRKARMAGLTPPPSAQTAPPLVPVSSVPVQKPAPIYVPPKPVALPSAERSAWDESRYRIVPNTAAGVLALQNGNRVVFGTLSEIRFGGCGEKFCLRFPNRQEVVIGAELEKHLPPTLRWQMRSTFNRDLLEFQKHGRDEK